MRSFKAASSTLSPSWMSMARLTFPSRLELNRPEGSFSAAPLANVILTTFLYVSPVQTMPPWDQTGVPIHFHSSTISGSASCMISRTFASVFPRQSLSSLILSSINAEAESTGTGLSCTASTLAPNLAALSVTRNLRKQHPHAGLSTQRAQHRQRRLLALLRPKQPTVRGQALAGVACRRRQKKYESPHSTPVAAAQPHASGPSPTERWAMSAEARSMAKPA